VQAEGDLEIVGQGSVDGLYCRNWRHEFLGLKTTESAVC
jgi:hypothetical protein